MKTINKIIDAALRECRETDMIPALKNLGDQVLEAFKTWASSEEEVEGQAEAFQDGAWGDPCPTWGTRVKDPALSAAWKAGRIWRLAKEAEVASVLGSRAEAILELLPEEYR